ncbi:DUF1127 domain-containing protein [Methyloraptor flagellatus]|uniref:DUF1127 domain-containing protein n=1 Tax=Methyloraptor flagellatus TaxID=3162530 RepID=A0AAU7X8M0_9HYPH
MLQRDANAAAAHQIRQNAYFGVRTMSISNIANSVREFLAYREAVRQLSSLDDRQLSDIGLTRGQIREIVRRKAA